MSYEKQYKTTIVISTAISALGWLIIIGGIYFLIKGNKP